MSWGSARKESECLVERATCHECCISSGRIDWLVVGPGYLGIRINLKSKVHKSVVLFTVKRSAQLSRITSGRLGARLVKY
jgi:hypothetical protein